MSIVRNYHRKYTEYEKEGFGGPGTEFFSVVRHPLDRLYSLWSYGYNHIEFAEFVEVSGERGVGLKMFALDLLMVYTVIFKLHVIVSPR